MQRILSYAEHQIRSINRHGVHSPFVYGLIKDLLRKDVLAPEFNAIEELRNELLRNEQVIHVTDLGAGSAVLKSNERSVRSIARTALKSPKEGRFLHRTIKHFQARTVVELGTSCGISTLYMAMGNNTRVHTIEGCPETARIAQRNFERMNAQNIASIVGPFESHLPDILHKIDRLDLMFVDGNHSEEPTVAYFERALERSHNNTVFIFDDIHWSKGMERAWERIKGHPQVTVTVDLYGLGMVFLRKEQATEHFRIRY